MGVGVKHHGSRGGRHCEPEASEGAWQWVCLSKFCMCEHFIANQKDGSFKRMLFKKKLVGISHYYITLLFSAQLNEIREGIDGSKKGVEGILICRWYDSKPGKSQEDK